ncbi:MAG: glycosyltransferase [Deltaproteobacteria bacterium]|jgi:glycosyltransferase involved in cell wall biosynthesis|nr:glycosyltransferase [Deltaproteobacteria bacterium]MBW2532020.1 glycosyltransferase [Deltaproteobacteria bacterium]
MNSLKTVLMLSRFFPPAFSVGGKRAYRFARYLPEFGWRAAILTDEAPRGPQADTSAGRPLPDVHSIYRDWYPSSWRRPGVADSDGSATAPTRERVVPPERLLRRIEWHLTMPLGSELKLAPRTAWLARKLATQERADAIFATSSPYAALLYGVAAKAVTGLPLQLDLRDPWSMNFLQHDKSPWTRWSEARLEGWLLRRADRVTLTCEAAANAYREQYPDIAARIGCIYNSFDPVQRPTRSCQRSGPVTVVHFGNCYGRRRLDTVVSAVAELRERDGIGPDALRVVNLGRMAAVDLERIAELGLEGYFESRPAMPYEEGLEVLARADLQLLLAYGEERLFIPAKLFDYLLAGSPILCVAPPSELTEIVARTGAGLSVSPGAVGQAASALRQAMAARREGRDLGHRDESAIMEYSARATAAQLAAGLDEMVANRRRASSAPDR